jgi:hypothetical protein
LHFFALKVLKLITRIGIITFDEFYIFKVSFNNSIFSWSMRLRCFLFRLWLIFKFISIEDRIWDDFTFIINWSFGRNLFKLNGNLHDFIFFMGLVWLFRPRIRR